MNAKDPFTDECEGFLPELDEFIDERSKSLTDEQLRSMEAARKQFAHQYADAMTEEEPASALIMQARLAERDTGR